MNLDPKYWNELLQKLGVRSTSASNRRGVCPVCQKGRVLFYSDAFLPTYRFLCRDCNKSGDLLDFICLVRKVARTAAISELKQLSPELGANYDGQLRVIEANREIGNKVESAWQSMRADGRSAGSPSAVTVLNRHFNLNARPRLPWYGDVIGQVFACADTDTVERWLRLQDPKIARRKLSTSHYKYTGEATTSIIVAPLRTSPDQINGFYLAYPVRRKWRGRIAELLYGDVRDSGILGHPDVLTDGGTVVAIPELRQVCKLLFKQSVTSSQPSRFVGLTTVNDHCCRNLQLLAERDTIFWSPTVDAASLRYATRLGSRLAVFGPGMSSTSAAVDLWMADFSAESLYQRIVAEARHWSEAVAIAVKDSPASNIADLIAMSELSPGDVDLFIDALPLERRTELREILKPDWPYTRVAIQGGMVEQRASGWYFVHADRDELITDCPFRIERATVTPSGTSLGIVARLRGKEYPLDVSHGRLIKMPLAALQTEMLQRGHGLTTFDPRWERLAAHISLQMYNRIGITAPVSVGLDFSNSLYRTSQLSIDMRSGRVERHHCPSLGDLLPLADGRGVSQQELSATTKHADLWAIVQVFAAQLLAQAYGQQIPLVVCDSPMCLLAVRRAITLLMTNEGGSVSLDPRYSLLQADFASTKLATQSAWWNSGDEFSIYHQTIDRPVLRISGIGRGWEDKINPAIAQQLVANLLGETVSRRDPAATTWQLILQAAAAMHEKSAGESKKHVLPVSTMDAVAGMVVSAVNSEKIRLVDKPPRRPGNDQVWVRAAGVGRYRKYDRDAVVFCRATINELWSQLGYPKWDLEVALLRIWDSSEFVAQSATLGRTCWLVSDPRLLAALRYNNANSSHEIKVS